MTASAVACLAVGCLADRPPAADAEGAAAPTPRADPGLDVLFGPIAIAAGIAANWDTIHRSRQPELALVLSELYPLT